MSSSNPLPPENEADLTTAAPMEDLSRSAGTVVATAHDALFTAQVDGLVVSIAEGEFPLMGTAAWLDWLFRGTLSDFHMRKVITGKAGETTYLPVQHRDRTLHLLLFGIGPARPSASRTSLSPAPARRALEASEGERIATALSGLGVSRWGMARTDFPGTSDEILTTLSRAAGELVLFD